jgi:hypothetical protein
MPIGKIEKLKEVNKNLKKLLIQMETRMFIENISTLEPIKKNNEEKSAVITILKQ